MGDVSSGPGGVLYNTPSGPSGLFAGLDPAYQAQQLQNQAAQLALKRATAFQGGVPTTDGTPNGPVDIDAIARNQIQNGDASGGLGLMMSGLKLQMLRDPSTVSNPTGQGGGPLSSGMLGGGPAGGAQPAAGGGMVAPGAGGDSYGRMQSAPAAPPAAGGQAGPSSSAPGDYLSRLAMVENGGKDGGDPSAAGAIGRYQFTASTWNGLAKQYPDLGLTADGRTDPAQQQRAIQAFTNDNISALGRSGIQATPGSLYLAHFAGAGGATAALKADPNTPVSSILGAAAVKANPFLDGMTAGGLVGWANGKMAGVDPSTVPGTPGGISPEVASAIVRLRTGQGSAADGATLRAYQASKAQGSAPSQPQAAQTGTDVDAAQPSISTASGSAIGDADVMQARKVVQTLGGYDPASLAPGAQQALTAAKAKVATYLQQQNTSPGQAGSASAGTVAGAPTSSTSDAPKPGQHPYFPGGSGIKSAPATPTVGQGQPQAPGGAMLASFGAAPPAMAPSQPMPSPGRQPPQVGGMPPGAPPMASGPGLQGGGLQPVNFGGGTPQGGAPAPSAPGAMPPQVGAALQRLQNRQGSAADGALWSAYMKGQNGGAPAGGQLGGSPPVGQGAASAAPSSPYGAAPPSSSGPDLPYLQGKYAAPGGGAQYVADMLDTARRYGLAGEQQAAQAFVERAKQVQSDLQEVNKSRLDLQNKNAELTPELKNYQAAVAQGFQGTPMDYQNALETQKAAANAAGRNSVLTPGQKEYNQAVTGGFQGSPADYQASLASQRGEAEGQGKYLGGLPQQYAQAADAGRAANDNIDQMLQAAQGFRTGAGADVIQGARKGMQSALGFFGINNPLLNDPTASYEDLTKLTGAYSRNVAGTVAGPKGVQELQLINSSLLSPETTPDGFRAVSSSLKGSNDFAIAKQQASQDWLADPTNKNSLSGFEGTFNRNVSPSTFWLNRLRTDQPDLFTQAVQRLGQTDQGRTLLTKAKAGMGYAQKQGLF